MAPRTLSVMVPAAAEAAEIETAVARLVTCAAELRMPATTIEASAIDHRGLGQRMRLLKVTGDVGTTDFTEEAQSALISDLAARMAALA